jgi:hypothetical protein
MEKCYIESWEERNILHTVKIRKANLIFLSLLRNGPRELVIERKIEGKIEVRGRRGRRRKQLLIFIKETTRYWKLKEETLDGAL